MVAPGRKPAPNPAAKKAVKRPAPPKSSTWTIYEDDLKHAYSGKRKRALPKATVKKLETSFSKAKAMNNSGKIQKANRATGINKKASGFDFYSNPSGRKKSTSR